MVELSQHRQQSIVRFQDDEGPSPVLPEPEEMEQVLVTLHQSLRNQQTIEKKDKLLQAFKSRVQSDKQRISCLKEMVKNLLLEREKQERIIEGLEQHLYEALAKNKEDAEPQETKDVPANIETSCIGLGDKLEAYMQDMEDLLSGDLFDSGSVEEEDEATSEEELLNDPNDAPCELSSMLLSEPQDQSDRGAGEMALLVDEMKNESLYEEKSDDVMVKYPSSLVASIATEDSETGNRLNNVCKLLDDSMSFTETTVDCTDFMAAEDDADLQEQEEEQQAGVRLGGNRKGIVIATSNDDSLLDSTRYSVISGDDNFSSRSFDSNIIKESITISSTANTTTTCCSEDAASQDSSFMMKDDDDLEQQQQHQDGGDMMDRSTCKKNRISPSDRMSKERASLFQLFPRSLQRLRSQRKEKSQRALQQIRRDREQGIATKRCFG